MSSIKAQERKAKTIFSLEAPINLSPPQWPAQTPEQAQAIIDLLCNLIQPLGDHKRMLKTISNNDTISETAASPKPKNNKRKRKRGSQDVNNNKSHPLIPHVLVGFNNVTSVLEKLSKALIPKSMPSHLCSDQITQSRQLSAVFVARSDSQPSALNAHLPMLCTLTQVPLLQLPKGSEQRLCKALDMVRVGIIGLVKDAPGVTGLMTFIDDEKLGRVEIPAWLARSDRMPWGDTKIKAIQTTAPVLSKKQKKVTAKTGKSS